MKKYILADLVENFSVRAKNVGGSEGLEFLGVSNEDGITKSKYAAEDKAEDYKIIEKGCFAYNPYRINVGSIAYVNEDIKGLISPAYVIFKTKPNMVDDRLLLKFLKSAEGLRQIKINARGSVRQALRFEDLCKIEISLPEYEKQVEFLDKIDIIDSCSKNVSTEITHQLDLIKNLRQAFLREAMQGLLVSNETSDNKTGSDLLAEIQAEKAQLVKEKKIKKPKPLAPITEEEIPFAIPENWTWCRLGEVIELKSGQDLTPSQYNDKGNGIPYITGASNLENEKVIINRWTETPKSLSYNGDLLLTCKGSGVGKTALLDIEVVHIARQIMAINTYKTSLNYIYIIVKSSVELFKAKSKSLIPGIDRDTVLEVLLPLPPLEIQERIVTKLDELMAYCDALEEQVKQSQQTNELLLQQVLREALG